jgi:hypothetical protein
MVSRLQEQPWKYWRSGREEWAVYAVVGNHVGETTIESVRVVPEVRLKPLLVVRDNAELAAVAKRYADLRCHIACPIAGTGTLIQPVDLSPPQTRRQRRSTRISRDLLEDIGNNKKTPASIQKAVKQLLKAYGKIKYFPTQDREERTALMAFLQKALNQMGFKGAHKDAVEMIRRLEMAGWGGDRDHFFHSFQNYFFGLAALVRLSQYFTLYKDTAKVHWEIDPFHVWLLVSLWHDVGHGMSHLKQIYEDVLGSDWGDMSETTCATFLKSNIAREAMLCICTLLVRLLKPRVARTEWMIPTCWPRRNPDAQLMRQAFEESFMAHGHSASSSVRLYADFMPIVKRLGVAKKDVLTQVVLMACASLPFHDEKFRTQIRIKYGPFELSTKVMPFAALLAFIDSIQDDRRDLEGVTEEIRFLERILVRCPAIVTAKVNKQALPVESLIWKVVEARDVFAHLGQDPNGLSFRYPDWMVG